MYLHMHEFLNSYADTQGGSTIIENRLHSEVLNPEVMQTPESPNHA